MMNDENADRLPGTYTSNVLEVVAWIYLIASLIGGAIYIADDPTIAVVVVGQGIITLMLLLSIVALIRLAMRILERVNKD